MLTLLAAQLGGVHRLAENLDGEPTRFFQITLLLVVLFQETLCTSVVRSHAGCLPPTIITARIALIELELTLRIIASINE